MISHDAASASEILRHGHSESRIGVSAERFLDFWESLILVTER